MMARPRHVATAYSSSGTHPAGAGPVLTRKSGPSSPGHSCWAMRVRSAPRRRLDGCRIGASLPLRGKESDHTPMRHLPSLGHGFTPDGVALVVEEAEVPALGHGEVVGDEPGAVFFGEVRHLPQPGGAAGTVGVAGDLSAAELGDTPRATVGGHLLGEGPKEVFGPLVAVTGQARHAVVRVKTENRDVFGAGVIRAVVPLGGRLHRPLSEDEGGVQVGLARLLLELGQVAPGRPVLRGGEFTPVDVVFGLVEVGPVDR